MEVKSDTFAKVYKESKEKIKKFGESKIMRSRIERDECEAVIATKYSDCNFVVCRLLFSKGISTLQEEGSKYAELTIQYSQDSVPKTASFLATKDKIQELINGISELKKSTKSVELETAKEIMKKY